MTTRPWLQHYPPGMPTALPDVAPDLTSAWRARVERDPDGDALLHDGRVWSARELDEAADALAAALREAGIGPGDRVGILLQNVPTAVVTLLAAWRCGAIVPLLNPMYHGRELHHLLADSGARILVIDPELADVAAAAAEDTQVEAIWSDGDLPTSAAGTAESEGTASPDAAPDDVALLTYTSGTTGPPKGAMNTHGNVLAAAQATASWMDLGPEDRVLCVAPIFHITGAVITLMAPLLAGSCVVLIGRTTPEAVAHAFAHDGVTSTTGSITVFNGLARLDDLSSDDFPHVRHLFSGGAPVPATTVTRFRDTYGHYIHNIYGMTETSSACIGVPPGVEAPVDAATGALAIGLPLPGTDVRIVSPDGATLAPGEPGELEISGPSVVPGYWDNPDATADTFVEGALRTGDGALMDEDGWVYIVDRLKDQINTSGYKVWPREVEDVLLAHPAVHECAVVGVPDDYRGEAVVAYAVLTGGDGDVPSITAEELREHARGELAAYKVPRQVHLIPELPKTPTGKIRRRELRESGADPEADTDPVTDTDPHMDKTDTDIDPDAKETP
ncbi:Long-chain-fatty-acid--CoA ligase [Serinicoccus hydrothermalis]|uniref:Long-chain-fatty-acid--CoA ligase n=1 Tax=Serinicoccus hydrothermalis TaxID=1758689 RepID=A0A1B1N9G3_9MICO|nr:AMP-binding protein [Serinicoccus hydrothermalis]ANS78090.1 Long-chain-fatty-acid--CoA ligase [Serinicoccus hydrothermalis]